MATIPVPGIIASLVLFFLASFTPTCATWPRSLAPFDQVDGAIRMLSERLTPVANE